MACIEFGWPGAVYLNGSFVLLIRSVYAWGGVRCFGAASASHFG